MWRSVRWVLAGLILLGGFLLFNYLAATEPDSPIPGGIESRSAADYSPWEDAQFRPLRPGAVGANGQDRSRDLRPLLCFLLPGCD